VKPPYFDEDVVRAQLLAEREAQGLGMAIEDPTALSRLQVLFEREEPRSRRRQSLPERKAS
jgi:hypothetical protein